jgi:hypothetical protein
MKPAQNPFVRDGSFDKPFWTFCSDTLHVMWNRVFKAVVKKERECWLAEILIPVKDFGSLGPNKSYPWGISSFDKPHRHP